MYQIQDKQFITDLAHPKSQPTPFKLLSGVNDLVHISAQYWTENRTVRLKIFIKNVAQFSISDLHIKCVYSANLKPLRNHQKCVQLLSTAETVEWVLGFSVLEMTRVLKVGFILKVPPTQGCPDTVEGEYTLQTGYLKIDPLRLFTAQ